MRWTELDLAQRIAHNPSIRLSKGNPSLRQEKRVLQPATRRKYGNKPTVVDNLRFDSQKEYLRWLDLKVLERAGHITDLRIHPKFIFEHNGVTIATYKADFQYREGGKLVVEDCKSGPTKTQAYRLRKRMMLAFFGIAIKET